MTPKLRHVSVTQVQSLPLLWDARKAGCGPEGSQEVSLLILENSLVTTQAVVVHTHRVFRRDCGLEAEHRSEPFACLWPARL